MSPEKPQTAADEEADQALRDARGRFVAGFSQRHSAMRSLLESVATGDDRGPLVPLREASHKMAGLAGVLGFPSVSEHAAALESALLESTPDFSAGRQALDRMGQGFVRDLAGSAPSWATESVAQSARILLVEDDADQRRTVGAGLRQAGYRVVTAESGKEAIDTAKAERPDLILLDVDLPELDGMAVCRQLKLNAVLSSIPIIFCTARSAGLDRIAGLTLGADDYLTKPFEPGELLLRIRKLLARGAITSAIDSALPYEMFATAANDAIAAGTASMLLVRVNADRIGDLARELTQNLRRRDTICRFDDGHLLVLMPDLAAAGARSTVQTVAGRLQPPVDVAIGSADGASGLRTFDELLAHADLSLAEDRVSRVGTTASKTTIVLAEDDPDVMQIVDARLKAAGFRTVIAFDGEMALAAITREHPSVVVLDLMMPKLTGFDVLVQLKQQPTPRPRVIVVSARGRDQDVTRSFELGADDYLTKPFNPDELLARVARLTR